jgi:hypothetical protein
MVAIVTINTASIAREANVNLGGELLSSDLAAI